MKLVAALSFIVFAASSASAQILPVGPITAQGSASDDFQLGPSIFAPGVDIGGVIERDRMYMAERKGFITKRLPITFDQAGVPFSGGRYLFDTYEDAVEFGRWLGNDFILDGIPILQRDYFIGVTSYSYELIGGWRWRPVEEQVAMRVERWSTAGSSMNADAMRLFLHSQLARVEAEAQARGYSEVWLAYSEPDRLVSITYFVDRGYPFASLASDESIATPAMAVKSWPSVLDRTSWVFTTWFHYQPGDAGPAALWPNSPPFPGPSSTDGLCEPSRGENSTNSPADCLPTCGDAAPDPGETTANCPSDVRLE